MVPEMAVEYRWADKFYQKPGSEKMGKVFDGTDTIRNALWFYVRVFER